MLSTLPQELVEKILLALDVESLRACSLVSSVFLFPSQRLIFRSLIIYYADIPKAQSLFAAAPHLLGYVRDVRVGLEISLSAQNGLLASILSSFHHLECLTIDGESVEWDDMTLPLQSAVHGLLTSASLHTLNLANIYNVPSSFILLALSFVARFGLYSVTVAEDSGSNLPDNFISLAPRMEHLILRAPYAEAAKPIVDLILPDSRPSECLKKVKRLSLGAHRDIQAHSQRLIIASTSTLRHLQLRCGVFQTALDLPHLPVLQIIELRLYLGYGVGLPPNLYTAIAALPTTTPAIEVLRLTFHGVPPDREDLARDRAGPFPLFDDTCAYRERLPFLQRVHCHWWSDLPTDSDYEDYADFSPYMHEKFPGLWGSGVLEISAGGDKDDRFD
ncbi:hypothetical protein MVEN_01472500 [Mycena venus]|uniref:F-box domain-containing protein n=1 Tax=Mycena venus TaxID=2733690 RepID=A0A8H6XSD0_9AGAR|nr:hypothetical protein MVEN_01472500 [Mycena venus]